MTLRLLLKRNKLFLKYEGISETNKQTNERLQKNKQTSRQTNLQTNEKWKKKEKRENFNFQEIFLLR